MTQNVEITHPGVIKNSTQRHHTKGNSLVSLRQVIIGFFGHWLITSGEKTCIRCQLKAIISVNNLTCGHRRVHGLAGLTSTFLTSSLLVRPGIDGTVRVGGMDGSVIEVAGTSTSEPSTAVGFGDASSISMSSSALSKLSMELKC